MAMGSPDKCMNPTSGSALLSAITSGFRSSGIRDDVGNDNSEVDELHNAGEEDEEEDDNGDEFEYGHDLEEMNARLKEQFGYPQDEKILGEYSCWKACSMLLPGYLFLTSNHVSFFASLPNNQDVVQMEGYFSVRSNTTRKYNRRWFVLKNDVLSLYSDQSSIYFPIKTMYLKDVLSAEPSPDNAEEFYIFTKSRKYMFKTDSGIQCKDWVKAIQKSIIHAKIDKDNVQFSLPFARIKSIELNSGSAAKTIHIVIDNSEGSVNELFFAYFNDITKALNDLKSQMEKFQAWVWIMFHHTELP